MHVYLYIYALILRFRSLLGKKCYFRDAASGKIVDVNTSDFKLAFLRLLPAACRYEVAPRTGGPCVIVQWLSEIATVICSLHLSVTARR